MQINHLQKTKTNTFLYLLLFLFLFSSLIYSSQVSAAKDAKKETIIKGTKGNDDLGNKKKRKVTFKSFAGRDTIKQKYSTGSTFLDGLNHDRLFLGRLPFKNKQFSKVLNGGGDDQIYGQSVNRLQYYDGKGDDQLFFSGQILKYNDDAGNDEIRARELSTNLERSRSIIIFKEGNNYFEGSSVPIQDGPANDTYELLPPKNNNYIGAFNNYVEVNNGNNLFLLKGNQSTRLQGFGGSNQIVVSPDSKLAWVGEVLQSGGDQSIDAKGQVILDLYNGQNMQLESAQSNDEVNLTAFSEFEVSTGGGADTLSISESFSGSTHNAAVGPGADQVTIDSSLININLGEGEDTLSITHGNNAQLIDALDGEIDQINCTRADDFNQSNLTLNVDNTDVVEGDCFVN